MLLQSHAGIVRVFPAIPRSWRDVAFKDLCAMGAFLVSAKISDGTLRKIVVKSLKGGTLSLAVPEGYKITSTEGCAKAKPAISDRGLMPACSAILTMPTAAGQTVTFSLDALK